MIRTRCIPVTVLTALLAGVVTEVAAVVEADPEGPATWSIEDRSASGSADPAHVVGVTAERHAAFDRVLVHLAGAGADPGYRVHYVDVVLRGRPVTAVPVRGAAALEVVVLAPAYDEATFTPTWCPEDPYEVLDPPGTSVLQGVDAGSYEGCTTVALGIRDRLPFRVLTLAGHPAGSRLAVDIAHR